MRPGWVIGPALALLLTAGATEGCSKPSSEQHTQQTEKSTRQTFEEGDEGWIPYGTDAHVEVVHDAAAVKNGGAALALRYTFNPGQYGSAVLPLEDGDLSGLDRLRFSIKADHSTSVIIVLSEKQPGGGYYSSWFWCPKDQWVNVSLTPQDFVLNQGPSDPTDNDGRLDLSEVRGIGLSDLGQAYQTLGADPTYPVVVDKITGKHVLFLDDFEWESSTGKALSGRWTDKQIGHPDRGFVTWIAVGGTGLAIADATSPLRAPGFSASYQQTPGHYVSINHSFLDHDLRGVRNLAATLASVNDANLMVYLEEKKPGSYLGPRYTRPLAVPGGSKPTSVTFALSEFQPDATGMADPNGRLDADLLKSISIVDITAADGRPAKPNTLWIGPITAR
jgi:hypothetical protein